MDASCVNPSHAGEFPLVPASGWNVGIVEQVLAHPSHLVLQIGSTDSTVQQIVVTDEMLDRYGLVTPAVFSSVRYSLRQLMVTARCDSFRLRDEPTTATGRLSGDAFTRSTLRTTTP
jgi:hypothetical protein